MGLDDFLENLTRFRFSGKVTLVTVGDVFFCHFLARAVHELHLDDILDFLHAHVLFLYFRDCGRNLGSQNDVFSLFGDIHCLEDSVHYLPFVEVDDASVPFDYMLYHI